jgi:LPPG:FO 2-phospho-L-lactate transferase
VTTDPGHVVELAGGVGGGKLARGLQGVVGSRLTVVVNTGDDLERHGLTIWPDHDTVLYALAGRDDRERGWGLRDETWTASEQLASLGEDTWFRLGDRDLATHLIRTERLGEGARPTEVANQLRAAFGVAATILPMSDDPVRTEVRTDEGWLEFQEYFVRRRHEPTVHELRFRYIDTARPTPEVLAALSHARTIIVGPSNPLVSIGPILALPGIVEVLQAVRAGGTPVVAVSPIVAGRALKGPADRMLASLGGTSSAVGVARHYADHIDGLVVDSADAELAAAAAAAGPRIHVTDTIMGDDGSRVRLAAEVLAFAEHLRGRRPGGVRLPSEG